MHIHLRTTSLHSLLSPYVLLCTYYTLYACIVSLCTISSCTVLYCILYYIFSPPYLTPSASLALRLHHGALFSPPAARDLPPPFLVVCLLFQGHIISALKLTTARKRALLTPSASLQLHRGGCLSPRRARYLPPPFSWLCFVCLVS